MDNPAFKIIFQLQAVIQKDVTAHFGHGRPTLRGVEEVRKYGQDRLDQYIGVLKKESLELEKLWRSGHPLVIHARISVDTRSYAIDITAKDEPKAT
jgi:hypothetical protein